MRAQGLAAGGIVARDLATANRIGNMLNAGATSWSVATLTREDLDTALRVAETIKGNPTLLEAVLDENPALATLIDQESSLVLLRTEARRALANADGTPTQLQQRVAGSCAGVCPTGLAALASPIAEAARIGAPGVHVQSVTLPNGEKGTRTTHAMEYQGHQYAVIHDPLHRDGVIVVSAPEIKVVDNALQLKGFRVIPVSDFAARVRAEQSVDWDSPDYERPTLLNVSSRMEVVDGVSLEVKHWIRILHGSTFPVRGVTGSLVPHDDLTQLIDAGFEPAVFPDGDPDRPEAAALRDALFELGPDGQRVVDADAALDQLAAAAQPLYEEIDARYRKLLADGKFVILWGENFSLTWQHQDWGTALARVVEERGAPALHRNHDFNKDRPGEYYLDQQPTRIVESTGFHPDSPFLSQVFIASKDAEAMGSAAEHIVPNAVDPHDPVLTVRPPAERLRELRRTALGDRADDFLVLAPVRPVGRKGLQHALRQIYWLQEEHPELRGHVTLGISHPRDDQSDLLHDALDAAAKEWGINLVYLHEKLAEAGVEEDPLVWQHTADAIAYPSTYEGYGNAFLESILPLTPAEDGAVYGNIVFMNRYGVAETDILGRAVRVGDREIKPQVIGFRVPESAEAGPFIQQGTALFDSEDEDIRTLDGELRVVGDLMGKLFEAKGHAGAPLTGVWADIARNNHEWVLANNSYGKIGAQVTRLLWQSVIGAPTTPP